MEAFEALDVVEGTVVLNDLGSDRQLARLFLKFHVSDVSSVSN